jgi:hypothetical protein
MGSGESCIKFHMKLSQTINNKTTHTGPEWWSKLADGLFASLVLVLVWLMVAIAIRPISVAFGPPGLLVFILGLLAVSMFCLQQALVPGRLDTTRAWYGIAGGFLAWAVTEVSIYLGVPLLPNLAGLIPLMMTALIVALLWLPVLPTGARFFALTFLLNWSGHVFMRIEEILATYSPIFDLIYHATAYLAMLAVLAVLFWIVFQTPRRIHRISGALAIWFLVSLALYVFRGSLF